VRFIEEWFGIWPDNGDGSLEMLILVALVGLAVLIGMLLPIGVNPKKKAKTSVPKLADAYGAGGLCRNAVDHRVRVF